MKEQVRIEPIAERHLLGIAELERVIFAEPWSREALSLLTSPNAFGAICLLDGEPVAYGGVLIAVDEGQITNIAVREDCRQRGLGHAVMQELEREARARGLVQLSLEVRVSNLPALSLYESQGFRTVGCRRNFYSHPKEDALVMIKTL